MHLTAIAAFVGGLAVAPITLAASTTSPSIGAAVRPAPVARAFGRLQRRVGRGVLSGRITNDELAKLRASAQALRAKIQALRASGTPLTPEQRQDVRKDIRSLRREIGRASRNGT